MTGLTVGHWTEAEAGTCCTVVLCGADGAPAGIPSLRELADGEGWS
jgi:L-aminopeptidase/D-esterase-like protein